MAGELLLTGFPFWAEILLAAALDLVLVKPAFLEQWRGLFHSLIAALTWRFQKRGMLASMSANQKPSQKAGWLLILLAAFLPALVLAAIPFVMVRTGTQFWSSIVRIVLIWTFLSAGKIVRKSVRILFALRQNKNEVAKQQVSLILDRDTHSMSRQGIARASCEAMGRGLLLGWVGPLFWLGLGTIFFRFAPDRSTGIFFSMFYLGLQSIKRFTQIETQWLMNVYIATRFYAWMVYFPARLTALFLLASSWICRRNASSGFWFLVRENKKNKEEGDAWPLAVLAGSLGIYLGGGAYYNGIWQPAPKLGVDVYTPGAKQTFYALLMCSLAGLFVLALVAFLPSMLLGVALIFGLIVFWGQWRGLWKPNA